MAVKELYVIDKDIKEHNKVCIFGTGKHAEQLLLELSDCGINVECFADRDDVSGGLFLGKPVISETELIKSEYDVVIASSEWQAIYERLGDSTNLTLYVDKNRYSQVNVENGFLISVGIREFKKDTTYILCPYDIGDALFVSGYVNAYKKRYNRERVCIVTKKSLGFVGEIFEAVDEVIADNELARRLELFSVATSTWSLKNFLFAHAERNLCRVQKNILPDNDRAVLTFYRIVLGLEDDAEFTLPHIDDQYNEGNYDDAVILMPYAVCLSLNKEDFWQKLAKEISALGYRVYTNVKDDSEKVIEGTLPFSYDLLTAASIAPKTKAVISLRSGICDLLAFTATDLYVLYPDKEAVASFSFDRIPTCPESYIREIMAGDMEKNELIELIIGGLK